MPIINVGNPMRAKTKESVFLRPKTSPKYPKIRAPKGLMTKAIPNPLRLIKRLRSLFVAGKKFAAITLKKAA